MSKCHVRECPKSYGKGYRLFRGRGGWACWEHLSPEEQLTHKRAGNPDKRPLSEMEARHATLRHVNGG